MDGCTFSPELYTTQGNSSRPRNLNKFIKDQERYSELKNMNSIKKKDQIDQRERENNTLRPQVDNLSQQIVDLMEERKNEQIHERLYKKGKEKLLNTTKDAMVSNAASMRELESKNNRTMSRGQSYRQNLTSLDATNHRGGNLHEALYDLGKERAAKLAYK